MVNSKNFSLLNTIKFNPYNLRSLKENLPKSAYDDNEQENFPTSRRKLLTEDAHNRNRTVSVR